MRSSDVRFGIAVAGLALVLLACSPPPLGRQSSPAASAAQPPRCAGAADVVAAADGAADWRHSIESGPLFAAAGNQSSIASCRMTRDGTRLTLEYVFRSGATLTVQRDPAIEYSSQEVRFASPAAIDPVVALKASERQAFGADGCSIDWATPQPDAASQGASMAVAVYRGSTCNCQARVTKDRSGRVAALSLRSTC